jgi:hypothetical protein
MPRCQRTPAIAVSKIGGQKQACQYAKRFTPIGVDLMADKMHTSNAQMPANTGLAAQGHTSKLGAKMDNWR